MDNTNKKLWFRRKRYGWGWFPVTWQGWLVIFVYVAIVIKLAILPHFDSTFDGNFLINFIFPVVICTGLLIWICYAKGERPKWQWGNRK